MSLHREVAVELLKYILLDKHRPSMRVHLRRSQSLAAQNVRLKMKMPVWTLMILTVFTASYIGSQHSLYRELDVSNFSVCRVRLRCLCIFFHFFDLTVATKDKSSFHPAFKCFALLFNLIPSALISSSF
jgi:hypothetical protein